MSNERNSGVSIGGNATGNVIQTGDNNRASMNFTQTTLPPPESVDIQAEFAALREMLSQLQAPDQVKVDGAVNEVEYELSKPEPDRDEVGGALERAFKYAKEADGFTAVTEKLKSHVTNAVSWLGNNWDKLLAVVGLSLK